MIRFSVNLPVRQFKLGSVFFITLRLVLLVPLPRLPRDGRLFIISRYGSYLFHPGEMIGPEFFNHVVLLNFPPRHFHALVGQAAGPSALHRLRIFYRLPRRTVFRIVEVY